MACNIPRFIVQCPAWQIVKANSLQSVSHNYVVLRDFWESTHECRLDPDKKSCEITCYQWKAQMEIFNWESLHEASRQHIKISTKQHSLWCWRLKDRRIGTLLHTMWTDQDFDLFWKLVLKKDHALTLQTPTFLPKLSTQVFWSRIYITLLSTSNGRILLKVLLCGFGTNHQLHSYEVQPWFRTYISSRFADPTMNILNITRIFCFRRNNFILTLSVMKLILVNAMS